MPVAAIPGPRSVTGAVGGATGSLDSSADASERTVTSGVGDRLGPTRQPGRLSRLESADSFGPKRGSE
jgi:hypothetical protein